MSDQVGNQNFGFLMTRLKCFEPLQKLRARYGPLKRFKPPPPPQYFMSLVMRKQAFGVPTRSDTNLAVHPQKMARGLNFWIQKGEGLFYPCSENKGADQLRGYREADLRLCFRIYKNPVFSRRGSYITDRSKALRPMSLVCVLWCHFLFRVHLQCV